MTDTWWAPKDIYFSREQMLWLIEWLPILIDGQWPRNPRETGYTEAPRVQHGRNLKAPFETPAGFAAEVEIRLKSTKEAGEALIDEVQSGIMDYEGLSRPAKRALNYISGWRRRRQSYSEFVRQNRYRGKLEVIWKQLR